VESGKQVARDAAESATEQGHGLASTLQDKAQESVTGAPSTGAPGR
jgi:hypothetical protein